MYKRVYKWWWDHNLWPIVGVMQFKVSLILICRLSWRRGSRAWKPYRREWPSSRRGPRCRKPHCKCRWIKSEGRRFYLVKMVCVVIGSCTLFSGSNIDICKIIRQNFEGGWTNHLLDSSRHSNLDGSWKVDERCFRAIELPLKKKINKCSCSRHDRQVCSDNYSCIENSSYF